MFQEIGETRKFEQKDVVLSREDKETILEIVNRSLSDSYNQ